MIFFDQRLDGADRRRRLVCWVVFLIPQVALVGAILFGAFPELSVALLLAFIGCPIFSNLWATTADRPSFSAFIAVLFGSIPGILGSLLLAVVVGTLVTLVASILGLIF